MKHCKKNVSVLALLLTAILIFSACAASPQNSRADFLLRYGRRRTAKCIEGQDCARTA